MHPNKPCHAACRLAFVGNCTGRFDVWLTLILNSLAGNNLYSWLRWSQRLSLASCYPVTRTAGCFVFVASSSCWFGFRLTEFCVSYLGAGTVGHGGSLGLRGGWYDLWLASRAPPSGSSAGCLTLSTSLFSGGRLLRLAGSEAGLWQLGLQCTSSAL